MGLRPVNQPQPETTLPTDEVEEAPINPPANNGALAGPVGMANQLASAIGNISEATSVNNRGKEAGFVGGGGNLVKDLGEQAMNLFGGSESIRARTADLGMTGGAAELGSLLATPEGQQKVAKAGVGSLQDAARAVFNLSEGEAKDAGFMDRVTFGTTLKERGFSDKSAAFWGLVLEITTDPLTFVGGNVVAGAAKARKRAITSATDFVESAGKRASGVNVDDAVRGLAPEQNSHIMLKAVRETEEQLAVISQKRDEILALDKLRSSVVTKSEASKLEKQLATLQKETNQLHDDLYLDVLTKRNGSVSAGETNNFFSGLNKSIQLFSTYLDAKGGVGKSIGTVLRAADDKAQGLTARWLGRFEKQGMVDKVFKSLTPEQTTNLRRLAQGLDSEPIDDVVRKIFNTHQQNWQEIGDEVLKFGGETRFPGSKKAFKRRVDSFPHMALKQTDLIERPKEVQEMLAITVEEGVFNTKADAEKALDAYVDILQKNADGVVEVEVTDANKKFLEHLVRQGSAENMEEAAKKMTTFMRQSSNHRFGNLEFARTIDNPFYDRNVARVLSGYYRGAAKRVSELEFLGADDAIMKRLLTKVHAEAGKEEYDFIKKGVDLTTGALRPSNSLLTHKASQAIRNFEVASKLGRALIVNATQSKNTAAVTGILNTAQSMLESFSKEGREYAYQSGGIFNEFAQGMYGVEGGPGARLAKFVLDGTGFSTVEKWNRTVAALAGRRFAKRMAKKLIANPADEGAIKILKKMDIDVDKLIRAGGASEEDLFQAGRNMATRTQFRARVLDTPLWSQSAEGKVLNQFNNFIENEWKFIRTELINEWRQDNKMPMIRYVTLATGLGGVTNAAKNKLSEELSLLLGLPTKPPAGADLNNFEKLVDNAASVGAFGMLYDLIQGMKYHPGDALFGFGPGAQDIGAGVTAAVQSVSSRGEGQMLNAKPLIKFALGNVPFLGPDLRRATESEATTKTRFTKAFNTAVEKGLPTDEIERLAAQNGISSRDLRIRNRTSVKSKRTKKRNKTRARLRASDLSRSLEKFGLGELS